MLLPYDAYVPALQGEEYECVYNTLNCIQWIAQKHKVREISDITFALSKFYSLSLISGRDAIKVRETATIIRGYLSITQMSFE